MLPLSMLFMSLICFNHSEVQENVELEDAVTKTRSFLSDYAADTPYGHVHFEATPIQERKLSPVKYPLSRAMNLMGCYQKRKTPQA